MTEASSYFIAIYIFLLYNFHFVREASFAFETSNVSVIVFTFLFFKITIYNHKILYSDTLILLVNWFQDAQ